MPFTVSEVSISDAEVIARNVEVPAMQNGPLFRMTFPKYSSGSITEAQKDGVIRWYIEMLEDAIEAQEESFLKVTSADGAPVGFCGWVVIDKKSEMLAQANGGGSGEPVKQGEKKAKKKNTYPPQAMDVDSCIEISRSLRIERSRVLSNLDSICRLTFMAVRPEYQRQGIGSLMMQRICEEADQNRRHAYVLAAPEGVRLYAKFGFESVGSVDTPYGSIVSMLRPVKHASARQACFGPSKVRVIEVLFQGEKGDMSMGFDATTEERLRKAIFHEFHASVHQAPAVAVG